MIIAKKDPLEIITVTFDFSAVAGVLNSASVTAEVFQGSPAVLASSILLGEARISGPMVMHRITGGNAGTVYSLQCTAQDDNGNVYVLRAQLPVEDAV